MHGKSAPLKTMKEMRGIREVLQQNEKLLQQNAELFSHLKETNQQLASMQVLLYCSQRYTYLIGPAKEELLRAMGGNNEDATASVRARIHYYDSYWSHQREQHDFYLDGLIPEKTYRYWLISRHKDFNISSIVETAVNAILAEEKDMNPSFKADLERERAEAFREQRLYRNGWARAKKFLMDDNFVQKMNDLMNEGDPIAQPRYLNRMLKRDGVLPLPISGAANSG